MEEVLLYHIASAERVSIIERDGIWASETRCEVESEERRKKAVFAYILETLQKISKYGNPDDVVIVFKTNPTNWLVGDLRLECTPEYKRTVRTLVDIIKEPWLEETYGEMECFLPNGYIRPEQIVETKLRKEYIGGGKVSDKEADRKKLHEMVDMIPDNKLRYAMEALGEAVQERKEEVAEAIPEGATKAELALVDEQTAISVETMMMASKEEKADFRSSVNIKEKLRTVMYEKEKDFGVTIEVKCKDSENAWMLQQILSWALVKHIKILSVSRVAEVVTVVYILGGIPAPKPKERVKGKAYRLALGGRMVGEEK